MTAVRVALAVLVAFICVARSALAAEPILHAERVLLRTNRGDLVLGLYPEIAPRHVEQILKLVRLGAYDSAWFFRVEPGAFVQVSDVKYRRLPLLPEQQAAVKQLPAELSALPHVAGVLTMSRYNEDINSAETSFSLVLAALPHLDGKYTIFGKLLWGQDVLDEIVRTPRDAGGKPHEDIVVQTALVKTASEIERMNAVGELRRVLPSQNQVASSAGGSDALVVTGGVVLMIALSLAGFFLAGRLPPHRVSAFNLLTVLVGAFLLLRTWTPRIAGNEVLATVLFVATIALFKLMNRFESPGRAAAPERPKSAAP